jgi:hypothetical protein
MALDGLGPVNVDEPCAHASWGHVDWDSRAISILVCIRSLGRTYRTAPSFFVEITIVECPPKAGEFVFG